MSVQPFFPTYPLAMPAHVSIICPRCNHLASFESPYLIFQQGDEPPSGPGMVVEWSGKLVQERFPSQISWNDPCNSACHNSTRSKPLGVAVCSACGLVRRHLLDWPGNAFFKCDIQGRALWAWNRSHLMSIQAYIESKNRNLEHPEVRILKIPRHFLISKHKDLILKAIDKLLNSIRT